MTTHSVELVVMHRSASHIEYISHNRTANVLPSPTIPASSALCSMPGRIGALILHRPPAGLFGSPLAPMLPIVKRSFKLQYVGSLPALARVTKITYKELDIPARVIIGRVGRNVGPSARQGYTYNRVCNTVRACSTTHEMKADAGMN